MMQSMNGSICRYNLLCLENNMIKKSNLVILDNSGIDYSQILLFLLGFLVYWKIEPNSHASGNTGLRLDYQSVMSKLSKKKCEIKEHNF